MTSVSHPCSGTAVLRHSRAQLRMSHWSSSLYIASLYIACSDADDWIGCPLEQILDDQLSNLTDLECWPCHATLHIAVAMSILIRVISYVSICSVDTCRRTQFPACVVLYFYPLKLCKITFLKLRVLVTTWKRYQSHSRSSLDHVKIRFFLFVSRCSH